MARHALSTIYSIKAARRWFLEFMGDQHPDVNAEALYLQHGSPTPPTPLLKEYLRYIARSRVGNMRDTLSTVTLKVYAANLFSVLHRETGRMVDAGVKRGEIHNFINNDLVVQEGVHTDAAVKKLANSEDVTYLTKRMYEREFVASFANMREFLNLNLYICLMVDCCERGGAIARGLHSTEEMCLRWEDICFYTFQPEDETEPTFDIAANVTIKWSKGQKLKESEWRTIPLPKLLPLSMAPEDSLRLLLIAAILDGVIDGVKSWRDLGAIRAPPGQAATGRRIKLAEDKKKMPVLRYPDRNHNLTEKPETLSRVTRALKRLGIYAGLDARLIGYCLRRGVANTLETEVSDENRRFLMGHRTLSTVYSAYHSRVSMVDTVRVVRDMPQEEQVSRHSSILLNRVDNAPGVISDEGLSRVYAHPDMRELDDRLKTLREEILARHPSLVSASRTQDPQWHVYHEAELRRRAMLSRLRKQEFYRDYAAAFQDVGPQAEASPDEAPETNRTRGLGQALEAEDTPGLEDAAVPDEAIHVDEADDWSNIDPRLWGEAEDLERIRDEEMAEAGDDEDEDGDAGEDAAGEAMPGDEDTSGQSTGPADDQVLPASMRLHQLVEDHVGQTSVAGKRRQIPPAILKTLSVSAYNDLGSELARAQVSEEEVSRLLVLYFGVMHSTHEFPAGFEPEVGTFDCRFCGESLADLTHCWRHVFVCAKTEATKRFDDHFNTMRDNQCGWKTATAAGGTRECGFGGPQETPRTPLSWYRHVQSHLKKVEPNSCYFGDCASLDQDGILHGVTFDSAGALQVHISATHSVWYARSAAAELCAYCQAWIDGNEHDAHMDGHLADAESNVSRFGYTGVDLRDRILIPPICPFHFHDETLPTTDRISSPKQLARHITETHIEKLREEGSLTVCPSYPSMCTKAGAMDAEQLKQHLIVVHGIEKLKCVKPRPPNKRKKQDQDNRQPLENIDGNSKKKHNQNMK